MQPLVSVIIPTYNRSKLLPRAVNSVLNQTFDNFELIIIDDCSTDNTEEVAMTYANQDSRVRYIRNNQNLHAQKARNKATVLARGEYIAGLDDDDEWLPQKLELQLKLTDKFAVIGCDHSYDYIPKKAYTAKDTNNVPYQTTTIEQLGFSMHGYSPSKILTKREYLLEIGGYDSTIPGPEGIDLFYRLVEKYGEAAWVKHILCVHYTDHGLPRITDSMIEYCERELEKNKHQRTKSAQRKRLATIDLMKLRAEQRFSKKVKHLLYFFSRVELNHPIEYSKTLLFQLLIAYPPLKWMLPIYRRIKYR